MRLSFFACALLVASLAGPAFGQQPARPRPSRSFLSMLFEPPPSVVYGVETPASRMARYYQLGGGVGPMPGESNGPSAGFLIPGGSDTGYSVPFLPGAGPDPALRVDRRQRVMTKWWGRGR